MTLIFLHGSGCTSIVWQQQLSAFKNSIALDFPGHPEGDALNSVNELAQWLLRYIDKNNLSDVVLIGHSLGSAIAMQAAILGCRELKGLVLIGAGARLKVIPQLLSGLSDLVEKDGGVPDYLLASNQKIEEPLRTKINEGIKRNGAHVMLQDFTACDNFDVMEHLAGIDIPVQVIVGDKDQMTPMKYATFLADQLPQASLDVIENSSHMVFAEKADTVNQLITSYLAKL